METDPNQINALKFIVNNCLDFNCEMCGCNGSNCMNLKLTYLINKKSESEVTNE